MTEITPTPDYRKAVEKTIERAVLRATNRVIGVKDIVRRSEIAGEEIDDATTAILILLPPPEPEPEPTPEPKPVGWKFRCLRRKQVGITMDPNEVARRIADDWEIEALVSAGIMSPAPKPLTDFTIEGQCNCARCLRTRRRLAQDMEKR